MLTYMHVNNVKYAYSNFYYAIPAQTMNNAPFPILVVTSGLPTLQLLNEFPCSHLYILLLTL